MKKEDKIKLIVVAGPTASGKSDIAIALARRFNGEIISADSRQVYRGMDIGTGKVERDSQKGSRRKAKTTQTSQAKIFLASGIRHWLLDVVSPKTQYSVAKWEKAAQKAIADIVRRGKLPIICGGTSFWIDTLVYGQVLPSVKPDAKLRAKLAKLSTKDLYAQLKKLDPVRATTIDRDNPRRLIRALEIVIATGQPVPSIRNGSPYEPLYLAITWPKDKLARRIELRLDARLRGGMIAEVKRLRASGVSLNRLEDFGLEYRWIGRYLRGKVGRQEMRDSLRNDIIAYSKRQITWLKRNKDIKWIENSAQAIRLARSHIDKN